MQRVNYNTNNSSKGLLSVYLTRWIFLLGQNIYAIWFYTNKFLVERIQQHVSSALGAVFGMLCLEGHTMCKAVWYTLKKYRKDPLEYGLDQRNEKRCHHRPVLLLHGAVGSWSYLGDVAVALRDADIPVFVINLGFGLPTNEIRKRVFNKIDEIRKLYGDTEQRSNNEKQSLNTTQEETSTVKLIRTTHLDSIPCIDIVAHSNGGNLALFSAFTDNCSYIDEQGHFKFRSTPQANPYIGKVITIALPANQMETKWMREINKLNDLFNINAKFDALMAYKKCALSKELPSHVDYIDAGHIGIVFYRSTHQRVLQFLRD